MKLQIPDFSKANILVAGDLMLDRYWQGSTSRISPEAPVPVVHINDTHARPGGAANVALNISALGANVTVDGLVGEDEGGRTLEELLQSSKVDVLFKAQTDISTIIKLRVLSLHQQLIRLDFEEPIHKTGSEKLLSRFKSAVTNTDVVLLSDYGKGALLEVGEFIKLARACNKPVLIDPKGNDFEKYRGATLLTPNFSEFTAIVGPCRNTDEVISKASVLCEQLEIDSLLVTRGEQGMTLIQSKGEALHLPAKAREVYDVTGAGDTVISTLAAGIAAGLSLPQATGLANVAAGISVGKLGAVSISVDELRDSIISMNLDDLNITTGIVDAQQLHRAVEQSRALGEKIVMTNGCFDLVHAGHVSYLKKAKELGSRLIVAVNDDDSVKRLKGEGRPVNPLEQRMLVLSELKSVDWVVAFTEDTPENLICAVLPDLLVKGGDYKPEEIAGNKCVADNGGETIIIDLEPGISTTNVINNIKKS